MLYATKLKFITRAILSKWRIIIYSTAAIVVYWVLIGLNDAGVIKAIEDTILHGFTEVKYVAQHCTPHILNFNALWECLGATHYDHDIHSH